MLYEIWLNYINIKLKVDSFLYEVLIMIEVIFKKYDFVNSFEYIFVDEFYVWKFDDDEWIGKLVFFFVILVIFIFCLGFFGLVVYVVERCKKEIGIWKVLGVFILRFC